MKLPPTRCVSIEVVVRLKPFVDARLRSEKSVVGPPAIKWNSPMMRRWQMPSNFRIGPGLHRRHIVGPADISQVIAGRKRPAVVHREGVGRGHVPSPGLGVGRRDADLDVGVVRVAQVGTTIPSVGIRRAADAGGQARCWIAARPLRRRVPVSPPSGLYCTAMLHVSEFASAKP